jgi:hypothetical protein
MALEPRAASNGRHGMHLSFHVPKSGSWDRCRSCARSSSGLASGRVVDAVQIVAFRAGFGASTTLQGRTARKLHGKIIMLLLHDIKDVMLFERGDGGTTGVGSLSLSVRAGVASVRQHEDRYANCFAYTLRYRPDLSWGRSGSHDVA